MENRCFIAGATGYTGRAVVRLLAEGGATVFAHVRPDSPKRAHWETQFTEWGAQPDSTPWTQEAMNARLEEIKPTQVYALLGTTAKRTSQEKKEGVSITGYEGVDYGLSVMVLNAAASLPKPPRFVYLSSLGVNGVTGNAYLKARWRVEEALRGSSLPYTIARPSFISGPDRDEFRPMERVASVMSAKLFNGLAAVGLKGPRQQWGTVSNHDLAAALIDAAAAPTCEGKILSAKDIAKRLNQIRSRS